MNITIGEFKKTGPNALDMEKVKALWAENWAIHSYERSDLETEYTLVIPDKSIYKTRVYDYEALILIKELELRRHPDPIFRRYAKYDKSKIDFYEGSGL